MMMKTVKDALVNLLKVKSIVTILLTLAYIYITIGQILTGEFQTIQTMVMGFYFGTQYQKGIENKKEEQYNTYAI